jgi:anti-sigma factor RsiW
VSRTNNPGPLPPEGLSPEEGRYLDGEMSPQEERSMEQRLRADPARAADLDAMDLWRNDTARVAATVSGDPDALADRILAGLESEPLAERAPWRPVTPAVARWYARAAALLIAIGISGTLLAYPALGNGPDAEPSEGADVDLFLDLMAEGPEFAPPLAIPPGTEGR